MENIKFIGKQLERLVLMTDNIGMIQHSKFDEPNLFHGYSIDDNARALIVLSRLFPDYYDMSLENLYFNYLVSARRDDGFFHNFKDCDNRWIVEEPIALRDCLGRVMWGFSEFVSYKPESEMVRTAKELFFQALPIAKGVDTPLSIAFSLIALSKFPHASTNRDIAFTGKDLALKFKGYFKKYSDSSWRWPSNYMTYCNARIPHSLMLWGNVAKDRDCLNLGLESLNFLIDKSFSQGIFEAVGNKGWYKKNGEKSKYDEQTIEAGSMVEACCYANLVTRDYRYNLNAQKAFSWFNGKNKKNIGMLESMGGVYDSITETGVNRNQGAESLLSYLMAVTSIYKENLSRV